MEGVKTLFHDKPWLVWVGGGILIGLVILLVRGRSSGGAIIPVGTGPAPTPKPGAPSPGSSGTDPGLLSAIQSLFAGQKDAVARDRVRDQQITGLSSTLANQSSTATAQYGSLKGALSGLTVQLSGMATGGRKPPDGTTGNSDPFPSAMDQTYSTKVPGTTIVATGPTQAAADYGAKLLGMDDPKNTATDLVYDAARHGPGYIGPI